MPGSRCVLTEMRPQRPDLRGEEHPSLGVPPGLKFDDLGLLTVVAQDRASGDLLMVAHANLLALTRTAETGSAHFWSRSRGTLWEKGATSGNRLAVRDMRAVFA